VVAGDHKARDVRNVCQQYGTHFVSNASKRRKVNCAGIGTGPTDDQLWFLTKGDRTNPIHVNPPGVIQGVVNRPVQLSRTVDWRAMGEVSTMREIKPKEGISGIECSEVDRSVGLRSRVGLNIDTNVTTIDHK
jgi:hypothetical protein